MWGPWKQRAARCFSDSPVVHHRHHRLVISLWPLFPKGGMLSSVFIISSLRTGLHGGSGAVFARKKLIINVSCGSHVIRCPNMQQYNKHEKDIQVAYIKLLRVLLQWFEEDKVWKVLTEFRWLLSASSSAKHVSSTNFHIEWVCKPSLGLKWKNSFPLRW